MPSTPVKELTKNQFAIKLGEKIPPQDVSAISITRKSEKLYEVVITLKVKASVENINDAPTPLPSGTFAVLTQGDNKPMKGEQIYFNAVADETGSKYSLKLSLGVDPPGTKGDHMS